MSRRLISVLEEETGAESVDVEFDTNAIKQVRFSPAANYETVANAAAALNADTEDGLVIWACGKSEAGHPTVAIQLFDEFLENAKEKMKIEPSITPKYSGPKQSARAAQQEVITSYPDSSENTLLTE